MIRPMAAHRARTLVISPVIALAVAACSGTPATTPSPQPVVTAGPQPTELPVASSTPAPSAPASLSPGIDPAVGLRMPSPYTLEEPSSQQLAELSGNIRGLPEDVAEAAGTDAVPSDFPLGVRFVRDGPRSVGAIALVRMPAEVAQLPGLLESIAAPVAAESNALLSYETIDGVMVGVLKGPIASAVAIVHGHLVMAQSGQPAVHPVDLMAAIIEANPNGFGD
jgi:hypothetical protein